MYESPINIKIQEVETQIAKQEEQCVLQSVQKLGIDVNKEELIKALNYDRNQYKKGYKDGVNGAIKDIKSIIMANCDYGYIPFSDIIVILGKYQEEKDLI